LPHTKRSEFDDYTPDHFESSESKTNDVLGSVQWETFSDLSSDFNHDNLDGKGQKSDENEDTISENSSENVEFSEFEKSSIKLIEKLHENKDLENIGEVKKLHGSSVLWDIRWHHNIFSPVCRFLKFSASFLIFKVTLLENKAAEIIQKGFIKVLLAERSFSSWNSCDFCPLVPYLVVHVENLCVEWVID